MLPADSRCIFLVEEESVGKSVPFSSDRESLQGGSGPAQPVHDLRAGGGGRGLPRTLWPRGVVPGLGVVPLGPGLSVRGRKNFLSLDSLGIRCLYFHFCTQGVADGKWCGFL